MRSLHLPEVREEAADFAYASFGIGEQRRNEVVQALDRRKALERAPARGQSSSRLLKRCDLAVHPFADSSGRFGACHQDLLDRVHLLENRGAIERCEKSARRYVAPIELEFNIGGCHSAGLRRAYIVAEPLAGKPIVVRKQLILLVPAEGLEPPTFGLQNRCSTS